MPKVDFDLHFRVQFELKFVAFGPPIYISLSAWNRIAPFNPELVLENSFIPSEELVRKLELADARGERAGRINLNGMIVNTEEIIGEIHNRCIATEAGAAKDLAVYDVDKDISENYYSIFDNPKFDTILHTDIPFLYYRNEAEKLKVKEF